MTIQDCWDVANWWLNEECIEVGDLLLPLDHDCDFGKILKIKSGTTHLPQDSRRCSYFSTVDNSGEVPGIKSKRSVLIYDGMGFCNWRDQDEFLKTQKQYWVGPPVDFGTVASLASHDKDKLETLYRLWANVHRFKPLRPHLQDIVWHAEIMSHDGPHLRNVKRLFRFIRSLIKNAENIINHNEQMHPMP